MKRFYLWPELSPALQTEAIAHLRRLSLAKAKYDGTILPYAWPERVAPLLRFHVNRGRSGIPYIWGSQVTNVHRKAGQHSIFTLPILSMDQLNRQEASV